MTLREAAELLGITPDSLRQAIARGSLKATKRGRDWWVTRKALEAYRKATRRAPPPMTTDSIRDEPPHARFTRSELARALDAHLPRMAFHQYGQFYTDDPDFDIEEFYERVADAIITDALAEPSNVR